MASKKLLSDLSKKYGNEFPNCKPEKTDPQWYVMIMDD